MTAGNWGFVRANGRLGADADVTARIARVRAPHAQVALDADQWRHDPLQRAECLPCGRPVDDHRINHRIGSPIPADLTATRGVYVLEPIRSLAEGQRDHESVGCWPHDDRC